MPAVARPNHRHCLAAAASLLATSALLVGCVPSESSRYKGTVSRSVKPADNANPDVASAFGLRTDDAQSVNLAAVDE